MQCLVVEDDAGLRFIYERVLGQLNFEVLSASDGEEAISHLEQHTPDLLFLDMLLPRVNGIEVLKFIAGIPRFNSMLIVIVTSNRQFEREIPEDVSVQFLVKPIRPDQIRHFASMVIKT